MYQVNTILMIEKLPADLEANVDHMWYNSQNRIRSLTIRCPDTGLRLQQDIGDVNRITANQKAVLERVARTLVASDVHVVYKLR